VATLGLDHDGQERFPRRRRRQFVAAAGCARSVCVRRHRLAAHGVGLRETDASPTPQPADAVVFIAGALQRRYLSQVNGTCPGNDMPTTDRSPREVIGWAPRVWQGFVFGSVGAAGWVRYGIGATRRPG